MSKIGIVVGMKAEAERALAPSLALPVAFQPKVFVSGASPTRAYEGAKALIVEGVDALLSFGLAGGLDPMLSTGDIVVAELVVLPDGSRVGTDATWRAQLREALVGLGRISVGDIVGQDRAITTTREKAVLELRTGAGAVDMESHATARAAREAGLPFMALRVILDPASRSIPWTALAGLGPDGDTRLWPVIGRLIIKPWELPGLVALGRAQAQALDVLGRLAADLGPTFVFRV